jgi:ABC-type uncharacterized transport system permease subunit
VVGFRWKCLYNEALIVGFPMASVVILILASHGNDAIESVSQSLPFSRSSCKFGLRSRTMLEEAGDIFV